MTELWERIFLYFISYNNAPGSSEMPTDKKTKQ